MPLLLRCTCGKPLRVRDELAGKKVRCPGCQALLAVPVEGESPPPVKPAAPPAVRRPKAAVPRRPDDDIAEPRPPRADRAAPPRRLVVRIIVLILALLGAGIVGVLGFMAFKTTHDPAQIRSYEISRALVNEADQSKTPISGLDNIRAEVNRFEKLRVGCYFMLATAVLGLAGGVLAMLRFGKIAALLLVLPPIVTAVILPISSVFSSLLILAGLLALLIRPARRRAPELLVQEVG
jgi:TRAP-type C4-dicarboxylate transport system permease small subunit